VEPLPFGLTLNYTALADGVQSLFNFAAPFANFPQPNLGPLRK